MKEHSRAELSISCLTCNSQCICFQVMMNLPTSLWGHSCSITLYPRFDHFYWLNCCLTRIQYRTQNPYKFLEARQREYPVHICKKVSSLRARDKMCLQAGVSPRPTWPLTPKIESVAFACSSTNCVFRLGYVFLRIDPQVRVGVRHVLQVCASLIVKSSTPERSSQQSAVLLRRVPSFPLLWSPFCEVFHFLQIESLVIVTHSS